MLHYFFHLMRFKVYLPQTLFLFFISMPIVLKYAQFHLGFDTFQTIMNGRHTHRSIRVE